MAVGFHLRDLGDLMQKTEISVVIIGRNEGNRLVRCLDSVAAMSRSFGPVEVIYVDSCSSDGSVAYAETHAGKTIALTGGRLSAARARNAGWQAASGRLILFLDGDTILHPDFPAKALAAFDDPKVVVVWGHRREIHPEVSIFNRVLDLDWIYPPGLAEICGGDALMARAALEKVGGFNPELIAGEEPDLCRRLRASGGLIQHIDAPMTGHDMAMDSWSQYWKRAVRAGHAYAEIAHLYKQTGDRLWSAASRQNAIQVTAYTLVILAAIVGSIVSLSPVWIVLLLLGALVIVSRTAYKAKWKSSSMLTMFLFGIHSHLQKFPIFVGQIRYWSNARRKWRTELIEYKKPL